MKALIISFIFYIVLMADTRASKLPVVINTWPWTKPTLQAFKALQQNLSLIDAVVAGCTAAEEDRSIPTVGWGGSPSENGETALDAMVMDGVTHNVGAVGSMKSIKNAIGVARHVLENTQHTFLVGEDATKFAVQMGFKLENISSDESIEEWEKWKQNNCQPNFWQNVSPDPRSQCGPYTPLSSATSSSSNGMKFSEDNHDTIGLLVVGENGNIAAGTSTNGAKFKITGRVGDSPIVGAGAYVDNEVGAASGTGDGDIMMRFLPSYQIVENMRNGMTPTAAAEDALRRIIKYYSKFEGALIAVNKKGDYGAACYGWTFKYSVVNPILGSVHIVQVEPIKS